MKLFQNTVAIDWDGIVTQWNLKEISRGVFY